MDTEQENIIIDKANRAKELKKKRQEKYRSSNENYNDNNKKYQQAFRDKQKKLLELAKETIKNKEGI